MTMAYERDFGTIHRDDRAPFVRMPSYSDRVMAILESGIRTGRITVTAEERAALYSNHAFANRMRPATDPTAWCELDGITIFQRGRA